MTDNELLLEDRIQKIRQVIGKYGEENFYISFSGGKDSTVLSALFDIAIPGNSIPRVFANTGIEYRMIVDFVENMKKDDERVVIIEPSISIKPMLETEGYPFKSKRHSDYLALYQKHKTTEGLMSLQHYLHISDDGVNWTSFKSCPKCLKYQFTEEFQIKISDMCCVRMKEEPLSKWQKEHNRPYGILGIMKEEGGRRTSAVCLAFKGKKLKNFQPLAMVTKQWEEWFIKQYEIKICDIYKPPYNFERTGCKGCPFNHRLQEALDILEKYFPAERKQCEIIWKPVYDEYRRIGYRLKKDDGYKQMTLADYLKGLNST